MSLPYTFAFAPSLGLGLAHRPCGGPVLVLPATSVVPRKRGYVRLVQAQQSGPAVRPAVAVGVDHGYPPPNGLAVIRACRFRPCGVLHGRVAGVVGGHLYQVLGLRRVSGDLDLIPGRSINWRPSEGRSSARSDVLRWLQQCRLGILLDYRHRRRWCPRPAGGIDGPHPPVVALDCPLQNQSPTCRRTHVCFRQLLPPGNLVRGPGPALQPNAGALTGKPVSCVLR